MDTQTSCTKFSWENCPDFWQCRHKVTLFYILGSFSKNYAKPPYCTLLCYPLNIIFMFWNSVDGRFLVQDKPIWVLESGQSTWLGACLLLAVCYPSEPSFASHMYPGNVQTNQVNGDFTQLLLCIYFLFPVSSSSALRHSLFPFSEPLLHSCPWLTRFQTADMTGWAGSP